MANRTRAEIEADLSVKRSEVSYLENELRILEGEAKRQRGRDLVFQLAKELVTGEAVVTVVDVRRSFQSEVHEYVALVSKSLGKVNVRVGCE